jgi:hypothetical protein
MFRAKSLLCRHGLIEDWDTGEGRNDPPKLQSGGSWLWDQVGRYPHSSRSQPRRNGEKHGEQSKHERFDSVFRCMNGIGSLYESSRFNPEELVICIYEPTPVQASAYLMAKVPSLLHLHVQVSGCLPRVEPFISN